MNKYKQTELPDEEQIRAEIVEAETKGQHKEPPDLLNEANQEMVISGHFGDLLAETGGTDPNKELPTD